MKTRAVSIAFLLFLLILCLSACDPGSISYPNEESISDVVSVELIEYNNIYVSRINTLFSTRKIQDFDFEKMEIIEVLSEDTLEDFLNDFSELDVWTRWSHPDSPLRTSIRIIYNNGDFDVISCCNTEKEIISFMAKYDSKGNFKNHIGTVEKVTAYLDLINRYFTKQITER